MQNAVSSAVLAFIGHKRGIKEFNWIGHARDHFSKEP